MALDGLSDVIILLVATVIVVPIFQAIRLGAVPGFLVAGVIIGPSGFGLITKVGEIAHIAEIGVVLLLFVIGIELKPSRLWLMRRSVFGLGTLQVIVTGLVLGLIAYLLFDIPPRAAVLIGPSLALSSTAFVLQILIERKQLKSNYGRTSFAVLLLQDLAVVPLLALVPLLSVQKMTIGENIGLALIEAIMILGAVILVGRYLLHPILHRVAESKNAEAFTSSALLIVLGTALLTEYVGLSMAMGAFLAGLLISDSSYRHQIIAEIHPFRGLLLGLFFISMGMSFNLSLLIDNPLRSIMLVLLLIGVKALILFHLAWLFGLSRKSSAAVAIVLAQSGEFALVLFALAFQSQLITLALFQELLLVVLLSMVSTPLLAVIAQKLFQSEKNPTPQTHEIEEHHVSVVLAGYGRVGHRIGEIFNALNIAYVALDFDAKLVETERRKGAPLFFGDVRNPEVLKASGADNAEMIIVTLNEPETTELVVSSLKRNYPDKAIFVRGLNLTECRKLHDIGASGVVSETIEASVALARMALIKVGIQEEMRESYLNQFRETYQSQIKEQPEKK